MLGKLPFSAGVFWKTLVAVAVLTAIGWAIAVRAFHYTMTPADYVGTTISGILLTYLVHLWILPAETLNAHRSTDPAPSDSPTPELNESPTGASRR